MSSQDFKEDTVGNESQDKDTYLVVPEQIQKELQDMSTIGEDTVASSAAPSSKTERLAAMFPTNQVRFQPFSKDSNIFILLSEVLNLDSSFVTRMEACGFVLPSTICNRFGLNTRSIAESFSMMGTSHVLDQQMHAQTMNLVIFARTQLFKGDFVKSNKKPWKHYKKTSKFNRNFQSWDRYKLDEVQDALTNPSILEAARKEMRHVRATIRRWIRQDSYTPDSSVYHDVQTPQRPDTEDDETPRTTHGNDDPPPPRPMSPTKPVRKLFGQMEHNLSKVLDTIQKEMVEVKASISREVDAGVARRMSATIESRTIDCLKKHLGTTFDTQQSNSTKQSKPDMDNDPENNFPDHVTNLNEQPSEDEDDDLSEDHQKPVSYSKKHKKTSFCVPGSRGATYEIPKSPLDAEFVVGCNDDLFSNTTADSEGSITSQQRQKKRKPAEFLRKMRSDGLAQRATLCSNNNPLKRAPLPSNVYWNGKCGKDFEIYIDKVTGHVAQQPHMGYLLLDKVAMFWLKYGNETVVLKIALQKKVHPSLHHISPSQFITDVVWLFGAMQQSITGRGKSIIREQEETQDGILTWKW